MAAKKPPADLTDQEVLILIARANLERYGSVLPPERRRLDPSKLDPKWRKVTHTCPKCGHTGPVATDFGVRMVRGVERLQSWCAECRSSTSYYNQPRKKRPAQP